MSGRRAIALVATREIRERLHSKAFIASTLLILALLAVSAVIGRLFDEGTIAKTGLAMERAFGVAGERPPGF